MVMERARTIRQRDYRSHQSPYRHLVRAAILLDAWLLRSARTIAGGRWHFLLSPFWNSAPLLPRPVLRLNPGASSGGCCSLGLRYGARGAGDEPFLLASHRVGEPQGAGARLPGVYFSSSFAVACCYFCARRRGRSVARRSSCVARALRGGLWRRRFCQSGRRVARREAVATRRSSSVAGRSVAAAAFLPISKPRAFRGGLWQRGRSVARRSSCVAGRSAVDRTSVLSGCWQP